MIRARHGILVGIPLGLLASGCVSEPFTAPPELGGEAVPFARPATVPAFHDVAASWELPAFSPWAPYVKLTLLSALDNQEQQGSIPDVDSLTSVTRARAAASAIAAAGLPKNAMWVVDMRGAASVAFGATLSQRSAVPIAPVITFNNWPAEREVVPAEETLAALCTQRPRQASASPEPTIPVFLLDSWRLAYRDDEPLEDLTDNRYMLTSADLPNVELLHAQGINQIIYVVERRGDSGHEEDDLNQTFLEYPAAGIAIHFVDLNWLEEIEVAPEPTVWAQRLPEFTLYVGPRTTVVYDPGFYRRSHGGFGGLHGGPFMVSPGYHGGPPSGGGSPAYHFASPHSGSPAYFPASPHAGHGGG
jgi:hypothetical protein